MDDLISRQAAIDALHMHLMYRMGTDSNKKRLDEWIPCTVRMPESGSYLVTKKQATGEVQVAIGNYYASGNQWSGNGNFTNVVAYIPVPDPWGGEEDD